MYYQGLYDDFICGAFREEQDDQEHIYQCKELVKMNQNQEEIPQYDKIFNDKVSDHLQIAKIFMQNMTTKEILLKMQK